MKYIITTNNPMVYAHYKNSGEVIFRPGFSLMQILTYTRDKIHLGHKLLTHPLSGSVKPNETPYKTIVISGKSDEIDFESLRIIEDSIATSKKLIENKGVKNWNERILEDFQLIDFDLILNAI